MGLSDMSQVLDVHKHLAGLDAWRSEEALASSLCVRQSMRPENHEQHEFRRQCNDRAFKRAARDRRLSRKAP